jgi:hypothetical protein
MFFMSKDAIIQKKMNIEFLNLLKSPEEGE